MVDFSRAEGSRNHRASFSKATDNVIDFIQTLKDQYETKWSQLEVLRKDRAAIIENTIQILKANKIKLHKQLGRCKNPEINQEILNVINTLPFKIKEEIQYNLLKINNRYQLITDLGNELENLGNILNNYRTPEADYEEEVEIDISKLKKNNTQPINEIDNTETINEDDNTQPINEEILAVNEPETTIIAINEESEISEQNDEKELELNLEEIQKDIDNLESEENKFDSHEKGYEEEYEEKLYYPEIKEYNEQLHYSDELEYEEALTDINELEYELEPTGINEVENESETTEIDELEIDTYDEEPENEVTLYYPDRIENDEDTALEPEGLEYEEENEKAYDEPDFEIDQIDMDESEYEVTRYYPDRIEYGEPQSNEAELEYSESQDDEKELEYEEPENYGKESEFEEQQQIEDEESELEEEPIDSNEPEIDTVSTIEIEDEINPDINDIIAGLEGITLEDNYTESKEKEDESKEETNELEEFEDTSINEEEIDLVEANEELSTEIEKIEIEEDEDLSTDSEETDLDENNEINIDEYKASKELDEDLIKVENIKKAQPELIESLDLTLKLLQKDVEILNDDNISMKNDDENDFYYDDDIMSSIEEELDGIEEPIVDEYEEEKNEQPITEEDEELSECILFTITEKLTLKEIANNVYGKEKYWKDLYNYGTNKGKLDRKASEYNVPIETIASLPGYLSNVTLKFPTELVTLEEIPEEEYRRRAA